MLPGHGSGQLGFGHLLFRLQLGLLGLAAWMRFSNIAAA
jgi:hypothetical protein